MNCDGTRWGLYDNFLKQKRYINKNCAKEYAQNSIHELANDNASYQEDAKRNGETQPLLAIREEDNVCKFTAMPNDNVYAGDIIECYDEHWIVIDSYQDEYGITTGTMWLCNHLLKFQNKNLDIVNVCCVIDDGSYSKLTQKSITTPEAQYTMYLPLTSDTETFYIDKRFAIGVGYDKEANTILQVMKATWVDRVYQNGATGNHLLKVRLQADVFDEHKDSIDKMICDYIESSSEDKTNNEQLGEKTVDESVEAVEENPEATPISNNIKYDITGKDKIRIGTTRTYLLVPTPDNAVTWECNATDVELFIGDNSCKISIPLNESLVGKEIVLSVNDNKNNLLCSKQIGVVAIG